MLGGPTSILSIDGFEVSVAGATVLSANPRGLLIAGSDGTNSRFLTLDSSGRLVMVGPGTAGTPAGGVLTVQGVTSGTPVIISGTTTANIGTTNGLALDATLTGGTLKSIVRGGAKGTTTAADVTSVSVDANIQALHVNVSNTANVTITSGTTVVTQPTAANLNATVIGTVTSNIGTTNGLALDATLTSGSLKSIVRSATKGSSSAADITSENIDTDTQALNVAINNNGIISTVNSSTATLLAAATFTGTSDSSLYYQAISISVMAIGASAAPGTLRVEQSTDGTNWDIRDDFAVDGGTAAPTGSFDVTIGLIANFFRVIYINGSIAQTAFRLQTIKWSVKTSLPNASVRRGIASQTNLPVQATIDAGRVLKTYVATALAGVTTEGLITLTPYADLVAGGTGTSFAVTSGKRLRLQSIILTWRNNTAAAGGATIRFRTNATGAAIVSSPVQFALNATTSLATVGSGTTTIHSFPDGFELSGTMQFALTQIAVTAVVGLDITVIGFEY